MEEADIGREQYRLEEKQKLGETTQKLEEKWNKNNQKGKIWEEAAESKQFC
jgi:hypothetical protein